MLHKSVSLDPNEKKALSVRRYLILLLLGLQLITVSLIIFISQVAIKQDIDEQAGILLRHAVIESKEHTQGFLQPAYRSVLLTKQLLEQQSLQINDKSRLEQYFLGLLKNNSEIAGAYVATESGDFFYVARSVEQQPSAFVTKSIAADNPGRASFIYRSQDLSLQREQVNVTDSYEFSQRPWYQQILEKQALIWTEPYIFFTAKQPGITVATPFYDAQGNMAGAVGFDITLTELSEFFSKLKIYGSVSAFMVSNSGSLVATPSLINSDLNLENLDIANLNHEKLSFERLAVEHFLENKRAGVSDFSSRLDYNNNNYSIRYESFVVPNGPEWLLAAYAPRNTFLQKIEAGERRNIWIGLVILALSILIGWVLIRKTWQPVNYFFEHVIVDQLTGLYNRRFLETAGSQMYLKMLRDPDRVLSIAVLDLDFFKKVNAEFGSAIGNRVLISFAEFLRNTLSPEEVITRYSGDTFIIILPELDSNAALQKIESLRLRLDSWPLIVDDLLIRVTFSAGIVTIDDNNRIADAAFSDYIRTAKSALSQAKQAGRDCVKTASDKPTSNVAA